MSRQTALSPTTRDLCARLNTVAASMADPQNQQTENELMAAHVRSAVSSENEPLFTEDVLKLAFIELISQEAA